MIYHHINYLSINIRYNKHNYMSIVPANYANTDAEFERILTESLNDCIVLRQDITDILLTKSVCLYVSNLLKTIIIHQPAISNGVVSKCISCYTESANVFNVCKCGLENICYSCMLTKYVSILTSSIKAYKDAAITNNTFNKKFIITLLQNTVCCKYCNVSGFFHKTLDILYNEKNSMLSSNHILHETDFLNNETKTIIDIFPNMGMTNFIQQKNMEALTNYGFELEYNHAMQNIVFKINAKLIEHIVDLQQRQCQKGINNPAINIDTIKCNAILITPAIFNAIYYKCIEFGVKNNIIDQRLLFSWNKYCQKMNKLLDEYNKNCDAQINYYIAVVLLNEIKNIII